MNKTINVPKKGDTIYIPTALYVYRGEDDIQGGKATVSKVTEENGTTWVAVEENPGTNYNWKSLSEKQEKLREEFGEQKAYPDPDYRPGFNDSEADWQ
jgi:hypothetical protein